MLTSVRVELVRLEKEVIRQSLLLYQMEVVQRDPEGAAEIMPEWEGAVERLREFCKLHGIERR